MHVVSAGGMYRKNRRKKMKISKSICFGTCKNRNSCPNELDMFRAISVVPIFN